MFSSEGFLSGYHSRNHRFLNGNRVIHIHGNLQLLTVIAIFFLPFFFYRIGNFLIGKFHVSIINSPPLFPAKACKQCKQHQKQKQNGDFFLFAPFFIL